MKKAVITMVFLAAIIASGQAQQKLKVGDIKNGKLIITEIKALQGFLVNSIGNSGTLGKDYQVNYAPEGNRMLVFYPVTGNANKVTSAGVMLVAENSEAFIVEGSPASSPIGPGGGGSIEIQCLGSCPTCLPNIKWIGGSWLPVVFCECTQGNTGECTMISKVTIHIKIGL